MKQLSSEKCSIAWFKLAECVERGDRERAFSLFRLLVHSMNDQPFLKKLEADIWSAFDGTMSEELYRQSAQLYKIAGNYSESLLIYELLTIQYPGSLDHCQQAIGLCDQLGLDKKKQQFVKRLSEALLKTGDVEKSLKIFQSIESSYKNREQIEFYALWVLSALKHHFSEQHLIKDALHKVLDGYLRMSADAQLRTFLEAVKELNAIWYKDAFGYCESQK